MNLKTTVALLLLTGAAIGAWFWLDSRKAADVPPSMTVDFLHNQLTRAKITRIEVIRPGARLDPARGDASLVGLLAAPLGHGPLAAALTLVEREPRKLFVLEKNGNEWTLPGNWPLRKVEAEAWVRTLTSLRTRFAAAPLGAPVHLAPFGLEERQRPLIVTVHLGAEKKTLYFGEEPDVDNPFTRATFVRVDTEGEVAQLGPGIFAALHRDLDFLRQKRLFPFEMVYKDDEKKEKVEQLDANGVEVVTTESSPTVRIGLLHVSSLRIYRALVKKDKEWSLKSAHARGSLSIPFAATYEWSLPICDEDRIDPAQRDALLRGFPDLWADEFVENKSLEHCGLDKPEMTLSVTKPGGGTITLLIGGPAKSALNEDAKPGAFRFAKIAGNDQLFMIKTDKLADIAADLDRLRDSQLARFKTADVQRVELRQGDQHLVLAKVKEGEKDQEKEKWRVEKLNSKDVKTRIVEDADTRLVEESLDKLAEAKSKIDDDLDAKAVGLDQSQSVIHITVEEVDKLAKKVDGKDAKKKREIVLRIARKKGDGKEDKLKDAFYAQVEGWPRVHPVDEKIWKLATATELAFRPRELWRFDRDALTRITIQADGAPYHLDRADAAWTISGPLEAEASAKDIDMLAADLAVLKCERFEAMMPKDLTPFGLVKPEFRVTLTAKTGKPRTLEVGKRISDPEPTRYAKLSDGDSVFVLSDKLFANLRKDPFDFLDKSLWNLKGNDIQRVKYDGAAPFALEMKKGLWQVVDAPVPAFTIDDLTLKTTLFPLMQLRAEKYAVYGGKIDWAQFGLEKPTASVTVKFADADKDKGGERVVALGKEASGGGRYARIDKKDAVAVLDAETVSALKKTYLDFVDPRVLRFDGDAVVTIERKMKDADFELAKRDDNWILAKPGSRDADALTMNDLLRRASNLVAKRVAAFPVKDLQPFGLDKPIAVVTLHVEIDGNVTKHVIKLGNLAKDASKKDTDERYALVGDRPMVIVLSPELSRHLAAPTLYFADRNLADFSSVDRVEVSAGARKLAFVRSDKGWQVSEPGAGSADTATLDDIIRSMQRLRADEIVADKTADAKKFGFDQPFAQWRFKLGDTEHLNLIVGGRENTQPDARRYARLGDKNVVFLLSSKIAAKLQKEIRAPWPAFRSFDAGKLTVHHAGKSFVLERKDGAWHFADDAQAKIHSFNLGNTLAILESLKPTRYLVDAKADLKTYGLTEPAWRIVLEVGKEKRELWLGSVDDKSQQMHATIPGSGAVFLIDEIDAIILARPRSAYALEKKEK
ncbi:MAG: DUF4340 domain-containing protein [Planctomycetes bacterium]|nr:DUF4340 domain-containing protein [Planctomycetota bacterium]